MCAIFVMKGVDNFFFCAGLKRSQTPVLGLGGRAKVTVGLAVILSGGLVSVHKQHQQKGKTKWN